MAKPKLYFLSMAGVALAKAIGLDVRNDNETPAAAIQRLSDQLVDLQTQSQAILDKAQAENRALTPAENEDIDRISNLFDEVDGEITRRERAMKQRERLGVSEGRQTAPDNQVNNNGGSPHIASVRDQYNGFRDFGEFCNAVRVAAHPACTARDARLVANAAPSMHGSEGVGEDGGFAVPAGFTAEIERLVFGDDSIIGMSDVMDIGGNNMSFPTDEDTPWSSTGIQTYWEKEAGQYDSSKLNLGSFDMKLSKLTALVPVTDEQLEDSPNLNSYLNIKVPEAIDYKVNDALINGTGAGQPLGIMNSGCLVTVSKETSQSADTIVRDNIFKMFSRMRARDRAGAVWHINQDIEPQLLTLKNDDDSPAYIPPGGMADTPYGRLLGRPVMPLENMQTLGDKGDIAFCNWKRYAVLKKVGGIRRAVSVHLWFDYDITAFKFTMRIDGSPWLSAPISPANGSNTYSPFVTLAERA